jgi:hypothetical protein
MYDPVRIVAWGPITTDEDIRVSIPPSVVDEPLLLFGSLSPIIVFSPIMHPSPICMGPSKEYSLARGWITVPEPIVIGYVPWKVAVSETVVVECTDTGARGGGAGPELCCDEDEETRWRWVEVEVEGGGLR